MASRGRRSVSWLGEHTPSFAICGDHVTVLSGPEEFYESLLQEIGKANTRIILASLYLGTDEKEQKLVERIRETCRKSPDVRVKWLLDYNRANRCNSTGQSSRLLLQQLVLDHPGNVNVSLFHTPDLRGFYKRVLPERWNEIVGLAHIKLYIFDDNVIISGANLSDTYFTNRQDRYIILRNAPEVVDFFEKLVDVVSSLSFEIDAETGDLLPPHDLHPFEGQDGGSEFRSVGYKRINDLLKTTIKSNKMQKADADTTLYPLVQMAPFGVTDDSKLTSDQLLRMTEQQQCFLASGYFNLTPDYMDIVVDRSPAEYRILYASPEANGFHGAKGSSAFIPSVYTTISRRFLDRLLLYTPEASTHHRVKLYEYKRDSWSFHGKGIWLYDKEEAQPFATFIGSPNFGSRSVYRDLEVQVVIATDNENLKKQLHQEKEELYRYSKEITRETFHDKERYVPLWVKVITNTIRSYF